MTDAKKDTAKKENALAKETDPFVKAMLKKIRNQQNRVARITESQAKLKKEKTEPTQEQKDSIASKSQIEGNIKDLEGIIKLYKESHGESPPEKKGQKKSQQATGPVEVQAPQVDVEEKIREALALVADATIFNSIQENYKQTVPGHVNYLETFKHVAAAVDAISKPQPHF